MNKTRNILLAAWRKWWVKTLLIVVLVLIVIRIILSPVVTRIANDYIASNIPGYYGHVDWIHFAFLRGAYSVEGITLDKVDTVTYEQTEFVTVKMIDLSVEWSALLQGKLVGEMIFDSPIISFTKDKVVPSEVIKDSAIFKQMLDIGMPLDINRLEVIDGQLHYKDPHASPGIDIFMHDIYMLAKNLQNTVDTGQMLPANVQVSAHVYEGEVDVQINLDFLADDPTFDLKAEVKQLNLPELNNFFEAKGKFTVEKGYFSVYSEVAAKDGEFKGYVKPLMVDLRILGPDDKNGNALELLWEGILDAVNWAFKNKKEDQLATVISLEGRFDNPKTNIVSAIFELLKNGFIQAINPSLDNMININSVGTEDALTDSEKNKSKRERRKENDAQVKEEKKKEKSKEKKK